MKEQFKGFPEPEPKVFHGEILPPRKRIPDEQLRYIFMVINNYYQNPEAPPPMVFIYPPPRHRPEDPVERFCEQAGEIASAVAEYAIAQGIAYYRRRREMRNRAN